MKINIKTVGDIQVIALEGDVDANTAPKVQQHVLSLAEPKSKILLNLTDVPYMSSAGLRMLLSLYRQTTTKQGQLVLVGLGEDIRRTMSVTGFLNFFTTCDTLEVGLTVFDRNF
ncbi:anti-sigma factor antagonist [Spirulina major CS-329]|uniref:anti-sigma factor antagonist n=1 Tax=Spirulina TaxID=1154 RepID=UPI00233098CB|nr:MULTISPECIES: anti-sigma factor antagonist [Spirulina]MDB9493616.1 anti-sigma factor antagonist [Spirulina subsalsa CS-330]MDB9504868.1 anti-sigma factor antagonist [Spirulina major CS-329]